MSVSINKLVVFFFTICFLAMAVPYLFDLGEGNVFKNDYYAKRIMTVLSFPFFVWIFYEVFRKKGVSITLNVLLYLIFYFVVLIVSLLKGNKLSLIIVDGFVAFLPVFFYLLVFKTNVTTDIYKKSFLWLLFLGSTLVVFNIKLQFSYFSLLAVVYILFFVKNKIYTIFLYMLLPIVAFKSLIGKSALLMLGFMILYFFVFDSENVSKKKKVYLLLIPSVLIIFGIAIFFDKIQATGSYRNFTYFLKHADFSNLQFTDHSTSHRLFEGQVIMSNFWNSNFFVKLFGNGFGSTIDLSGTVDKTIGGANTDIHNVRNIHMGFFAVLSRYGVIGLVIYLSFIFRMLSICWKTLKKRNHYSIILGCLYVLILLFDSLISFPHMMSNFLFWLITFMVLLEYKTFNQKKPICSDVEV